MMRNWIFGGIAIAFGLATVAEGVASSSVAAPHVQRPATSCRSCCGSIFCRDFSMFSPEEPSSWHGAAG